jgi:hypothetical protein
MRIVGPSIRSLKVETGPRVSQQRFHCLHRTVLEHKLPVGNNPRSALLKLKIRIPKPAAALLTFPSAQSRSKFLGHTDCPK